MYDLPSEDPQEPGLPDEFHLYQPQVLSQTCRPTTYPANRIFIASDLNIYYDPEHLNWHKRPDWFVVVGIPRLYQDQVLRQSYVIWDERVSPLLVVELLSPGTEKEDLGQTLRQAGQPPTKWQVYEQILRVPYYATFDETNGNFRRFILQGDSYQELNHASDFWIAELQLGLGVWQGSYQGIETKWLRWYNAEGIWLPTEEEQIFQERQRAEQEHQRAEQERQRAEQERQRAEQERQRAEQERQRAEVQQQEIDRLKARLKALGLDPEI